MNKQRYEFTIYKPNAKAIDGISEPYLYVKTVFSRNEAKQDCPIDSGNYASVALTEAVNESDDYGPYTRWEAISSGTLEPEELHSNQPLDKFLYSLN